LNELSEFFASFARISKKYKEFERTMEGKLKRIRFNKDGTLDFDIETEDGKMAIAKGCSHHVERC
jgi:hypothetical protein